MTSVDTGASRQWSKEDCSSVVAHFYVAFPLATEPTYHEVHDVSSRDDPGNETTEWTSTERDLLGQHIDSALKTHLLNLKESFCSYRRRKRKSADSVKDNHQAAVALGPLRQMKPWLQETTENVNKDNVATGKFGENSARSEPVIINRELCADNDIPERNPALAATCAGDTARRGPDVSNELFIDLTTAAAWSALSESWSIENKYPWDMEKLHRLLQYSAMTTENCWEAPTTDSDRSPVFRTAASKLEWWDRPAWAWTWQQMLLAQGAMIGMDLIDAAQLFLLNKHPDARLRLALSSSQPLARLPFLYCNVHSKSSDIMASLPRLILIDPDQDREIVIGPSERNDNDRVGLDGVCFKSGDVSFPNSTMEATLQWDITNYRNTVIKPCQPSQACDVNIEKLHAPSETMDCACNNVSVSSKCLNEEVCESHPMELAEILQMSQEALPLHGGNDCSGLCIDSASPATGQFTGDGTATTPTGTDVAMQYSKQHESEDGYHVIDDNDRGDVHQPTAEDECRVIHGNDNGVVHRSTAEDECRVIYESDRGVEHRPTIPQIDSQGVDLTILSQLPAALRSEARIAIALRDVGYERKGKQLPNRESLCLEQWFLPSTVAQRAKHRVPKAMWSATKRSIQQRNAWLTANEVDTETLRELPEEIREMIQAEIAQGLRVKRARQGITSFFHPA